VCAQELTAFFVEDYLDQPLILAECDGLAIADKWETTDAYLELLSDADASP
jgi:hypothetical protein